ncbi:Glycosyltransferase involved in cell wall bisynthesis [Ornithinimicrobium cerasi]|uniref:Glycosyltransferase involved in cell wall bisynthesis n=1 Tax=Ornithinimicrobium cerasi TaxID=2248773 RepID=A0A285VM78_9MICO|nr:Glycosyltransferase involved in cell wall bisynthesis [Ornithinimicrobium cerasi]
MRVLLVTGLVAGGVGRHVEMLVRGLRARGHQVVVACPAAVSSRFDLGRTVALPVGSRPNPVRDVPALRTLRPLVAGADVVHAHGLRAGALAVLARGVAARRPTPARRRPRLVVTSHNAPPQGRAARAVYVAMERLVARGADLVLGVSPDLVERSARAGAVRTGQAVVPAAWAAPVDRTAARSALGAELGLPDQARVVLVVGRLAPQKGLETAVAAHAALVEVHDPGASPVEDAHLVIVGEGPERSWLADLAARPGSGVHLLGHRPDVPALLAAADVVLSTARWEGQPVWLQEALQQGAAIVATDVGGTAAVVGDAALLVRGGHAGTTDAVVPEDVAVALRRVLRDDAFRDALRGRALARAAELPTEDDALGAALAAYLGPG